MKPTHNLAPIRYTLLTVALGMTFLCGLANCGSHLGGGGAGASGGAAGQQGYCACGGTPPYCWDTAGCPGGEVGGSGGAAGSGGTGGAAGSGGSGGTGGGPGGTVGAVWAPPSCLGGLFATCPMDGECHYTADTGLRYCFTSGTRAVYVTSHSCGASNVTSDLVNVNKPDGSLCYTFEATWHPSCENAQWSWKDAAGQVVATGSGSWGQGTYGGVQCAAGGASVACGSGSGPTTPALTGALGPFGPTTCPAGSCP